MELTPEVQDILRNMTAHLTRWPGCAEDPCFDVRNWRNRLKALGYTYTVVDIGNGEVL